MKNDNERNKVVIDLPASKSISNRLLILQSLYGKTLAINGLSDAEDTFILQKALNSNNSIIDVGMAGTAFRFLTAYYSIAEGEKILTGSERMKSRPIGSLVDALRSMGAEIEYLENTGFPPIKIRGKALQAGKVEIEAGESSQFATALMLIAAKLKNGLKLKFKGKKVSGSYIEMTADLMKQCNIAVEISSEAILIQPRESVTKSIDVEKDWSSASFFYNFLCCSGDQELQIVFPDLSSTSIQGDAALIELYSHLGIETQPEGNNIKISKNGTISNQAEFDFINTPDLIQPFLVSCTALNKKVKIFGAKTLRLKETDRVEAMKNELQKIGAQLKIIDENTLELIPFGEMPESLFIRTYKDHRMAMSFAPIFQSIRNLKIENPEVVSKSFPNFWLQMKKLGWPL